MRLSATLTLLAIAAATCAAPQNQHQASKRKNVDRPDPANLSHCPDNTVGDADRCTYEISSQGPDQRIHIKVGDPTHNCAGSPGPVEKTDTITWKISQTWKYGVSEGFSADGGEELPIGVSFENSDGWSNTETKSFSQSIGINVPPGKKGQRIAKVLHHTYNGRVRLNYGDPSGEPGEDNYHYIWYKNGVGSIQPTDDVSYDQILVDCNEEL
ncbi:hypothetical protein VNI00_002664 [Paramarasmius palmivorus]|uniref:Uncharacterized protein n=1 Tax=Paramarasmius palmivorus TaxID=297713 RepID=A0AAW0E080_9AGAR